MASKLKSQVLELMINTDEKKIFSSPYDLCGEDYILYNDVSFRRILRKIKIGRSEKIVGPVCKELLREWYRFARRKIDLKYALRLIAFSDTLSMSDLPIEFHQNFLCGSHPYGITLSVDEIGSDSLIGQNCTFGANYKFRKYNEGSAGYKPRLGHLVVSYPGSVVSGPVSIGHCTLIASNAMVTKDIPGFSIVTGVNEIRPLSDHHYKIFLSALHHQLIVCRRPAVGLVYSKGRYYEDVKFTSLKEQFLNNHRENTFDQSDFIKVMRSQLS